MRVQARHRRYTHAGGCIVVAGLAREKVYLVWLLRDVGILTTLRCPTSRLIVDGRKGNFAPVLDAETKDNHPVSCSRPTLPPLMPFVPRPFATAFFFAFTRISSFLITS